MAGDKAAELGRIADQVKACTLCRLHEGRTNAVPGAGSLDAEIMFIGEGPGFNEDKQGLPFVGASGNYLTQMLTKIGLSRGEVFITNVVKCRPPENRDPMQDEIDACKPYLDAQIAQIDPLVIVTLGRYSMARYFPGGKITKIHGQPRFEGGRAYYPLFHPAAVLRNPNMQTDYEADFQKLHEVLAQVKALRTSDSPPAAPPPSDEPPTQLTLF
jgi:DNA polymerase